VGQLPFELGNITELTRLYITNSDLSAGPIPDSIGKCTKLKTLQIQVCKLQGPFPVGLRELKLLGMPIELSMSNALDTVSLYKNNFSGSIPIWICELVLLTSLSLTFNRFNGTIPECIGSLKRLQELSLNSNAFSGELTIGICDLVNLDELNLYDTDIEGIQIQISN
jgi:LRR receptor-like serine/threonine-protein kinase FLS2